MLDKYSLLWVQFMAALLTMVLAAAVHGQSGGVYNIANYGCTTGSPDNTANAQTAINRCEAAGGGIVLFPAGTWTFKGTLKVTDNFVRLQGQGTQTTTLNFNNGALDCILFGRAYRPGGIDNTRCGSLTDMLIVTENGHKTAGRAIAVSNHYNFHLENVMISDAVVGFYACYTNDTTLHNVIIYATDPYSANSGSIPFSTNTGVYWDSPPIKGDPSTRSDVLVLDDVTIQLNACPGTGVLWDGFTNTMNMTNCFIMGGDYGLRIRNSYKSNYGFPEFLQASNLAIENCGVCASIEAGYEFKFDTSDMDMCPGNTFQVLPDLASNGPVGVDLTNSRIGGCKASGLYLNGKNELVSNCLIFSSSMAGAGRYPAISIGSGAQNVAIDNVQAEEYIGAGRASYGVSIASGAKKITIDNLDASMVQTAAVQNLGATSLHVGQCLEPNGTVSGLYYSGPVKGTNSAYFACNNAGGANELCCENRATGSGVAAFLATATGTANAYMMDGIEDNKGTPYALKNFGSAVTDAFTQVGENIFESAGAVERLRIGTEGIMNSVPYTDHATLYVDVTGTSTTTVSATHSRIILITNGTYYYTIKLPKSAQNGQLLYVSCVSSGAYILNVSWTGPNIGAPASIAAGHTIVFQYYGGNKWLCVQAQ